MFNWPLMDNNITRDDLDTLIEFLKGEPRLTQSANVAAFEEEWSQWLGVKHSVFVNSGASANLATITALKHLYGSGEIIVPTLTWVSDISSVLWNGFTPVFVDINPRTLCMNEDQVLAKITPRTKAVFITYVQGFNGLSDHLLDELRKRNIPLIEDVCESHGATFKGQKLGSFGLASNFSFYFAHHLSTVEGGMLCTNDEDMFNAFRMLRSHGMTREAPSKAVRERYIKENPSLSPDFIFAFPAFNIRSTEINAVLGRSQLKKLDKNNILRTRNFKLFLSLLDGTKYRTDFEVEGSCNYAFNVVFAKADLAFRERFEKALSEGGVEFRRGSAGGGNQLRQHYLKEIVAPDAWKCYPEVEHIHHFGYYVGNYPALAEDHVRDLCALLNSIE